MIYDRMMESVSVLQGSTTQLQGSQARRRVQMHEFFWKGLRPADRIVGPNAWGCFGQISRPNALPRPQRPPGGHLVEIGHGPSTSWSKLAMALPPAGRNLQGEDASPAEPH
jgi:hypothetical protein